MRRGTVAPAPAIRARGGATPQSALAPRGPPLRMAGVPAWKEAGRRGHDQRQEGHVPGRTGPHRGWWRAYTPPPSAAVAPSSMPRLVQDMPPRRRAARSGTGAAYRCTPKSTGQRALYRKSSGIRISYSSRDACDASYEAVRLAFTVSQRSGTLAGCDGRIPKRTIMLHQVGRWGFLVDNLCQKGLQDPLQLPLEWALTPS